MLSKVKTRLIKAIMNPKRIIIFAASKGCFNWLSDEQFLRLVYYAHLGKNLDFKNPKTYNEKLQWLKLYDRRPEQSVFVDKYVVRDYIANTIGEKYLVPLLGVYSSFDEIDFSKLPNQFVLKCTHDSGGIIICKDKNKLDIKEAKIKINKCLIRNFYYYTREWPYKNVVPNIICEKYLQDNITDYKFMCFNGEPKLIQVHRNRGQADHTLDFYDTNWNKTPISRSERRTVESTIPRPLRLNEMLDIARKLSANEIHVRIDLYEVDGKICFGEKTYYSASGLKPFAKDEYDKLLGSWIKLPIESS